ncbi:MAG: MGMT family protein [Mycobacteriales bacterium]
MADELTDFARRVLDVVDRIPSGSVLSYGDIAELVVEAGSRRAAPRAVGAVMARFGGEVPWHRVVYSDGRLPAGHEARAARLLRAEGVPVRGGRVDLPRTRWSGR